MSIKAVELRNVRKSYSRIEVLNGIDLDVYRGDIFGFLGPNGAGKTTTIYVILGLVRPDEGEVKVFGKTVDFHDQENLREVKKRIGVVHEDPGLYPHLCVEDYLTFYARLYGLSKSQVRGRVREVLEAVGLWERRRDQINKLSRGMKQRVAIARSIIHNPELLILDEPSASLDPEWQVSIRNMLARLNKENGTTVFISSHNLSEIERICSRVAIIVKGEIKKSSSIEELMSLCERRFVLRLKDHGDADKAAKIIGNELGYTVVHKELDGVIVKGREVAVIDLVYNLKQKGIEVLDLNTEPCSLEDIYLKMVK